MIGPSERLDTVATIEGSLASVLALVPSELVRARKARTTPRYIAQVRLFTCVNSLVCLQMRAFGVDFVTARVLAIVYAPFLQLWIIVATSLDLRG